MKLSSLNELLLHELKDIYDAEHQLVKALPDMVEAATEPELKMALDGHLEETRGHVIRLEQVFHELRETPDRETCHGMKGLVSEGEKVLKHTENAVRDAGLIGAAQKVEHYEIAAYGTLIRWADTAGEALIVSLLQQNLDEEIAADEKLSRLAQSSINAGALGSLNIEASEMPNVSAMDAAIKAATRPPLQP